MSLLVIDGNSIINRAFYGVKALTTADGHFTNAIVGFLNILQKLRDMTQADAIAVAFDVHAPTFRHGLYAGYKAGRKGMPPELREQVQPLKDILCAMGLTLVEREGYEADDILGTLSAAAEAAGQPCTLATGDRDALQLVSEHTTVLLATTKAGRPDTVRFDPAAVREKYGLSPAQLIDLKALMGDTSDNIPGVPGVGEKTAIMLMQRFGSLDAVYEQIASPEIRDSLRAKLEAGHDSALLSRTLGTICRTAPIDTDLTRYAVGELQRAQLAGLLGSLSLYKWMEKLGLSAADAAEGAIRTADAPVDAAAAVWLSGADAAAALAEKAKTAGRLDVIAAVEGDEIVSLAAAADGSCVRADRMTPGFDALCALLTDPGVQKRTHDSKPLFAALLAQGKQPCAFTLDTALAAYLLDPLSSDYTLPHLLRVFLPAAAQDDPLPVFGALCDRLTAAVDEQQMLPLLTEIEQPLAEVLASMENVGCAVDRAGIADLGRELTAKLAVLQDRIYAEVGYAFNLNSPKQLGTALFEDLGLPAGKKTKSGYSTNADVLEKLRPVHPVIDMILEYRKLAKLNSTYCDGLLKVISPDGRIHSVFNQTETRTGRISSSEPNLQNIPVRSEIGRQMRRFFCAREGWTLCDADYSQIELRVLAHMANEPTMLDCFNSGEDIHTSTAAQVFGVPEELVTPQMRSRAKAVNFGIIYGIGAYSLGEDIGVSFGEAKKYIDRYLQRFSQVSAFMDRLIADATEKGYAETLLHRRRPLPELKAGNAVTRHFGERVARNMPIQGTAADIIKIAMVHVYRRLRDEGLQARLILQIHDELLVEAPPAESERVCALLREEMEHAATLRVRLVADVHTGITWADAKG